jgi:hypothetical protein
MGRPLKRDVLGTDVIGTPVAPNAGITVQFFDTQLRTDGAIIKQRGAKTFVVTQRANILDDLDRSTGGIACVLQAAEPSAAGQMRIFGSTSGVTPGDIAIRKITKRIAWDFNDNKYTWFLDDDSSADVLVLTLVA